MGRCPTPRKGLSPLDPRVGGATRGFSLGRPCRLGGCEHGFLTSHSSGALRMLVSGRGSFGGSVFVVGIIAEVWCEPLFGLGDGHALALGIIGELIFVDGADGEVAGIGVCEVESGDGGGGEHGEAFGEMDADGVFDVEEIKEGAFFGVVGASGITRGGSDTAIAFVDQIVVVEVFLFAVAPFVADALVEVFGEGFGESVGEGFCGDGVVIVVIGFVVSDHFIGAKASADAECADIVEALGVCGCDKIGERVEGGVSASALLAEGMEAGEEGGACVVGVDEDIVAVAVCGEEAVDAVSLELFVGDDLAQHALCVVEEFLCGLADLGVLEDGGIRAVKFPCAEERGPVDEGDELFEREVLEGVDTKGGGLWDIGLLPIAREAAFDGFVIGFEG